MSDQETGIGFSISAYREERGLTQADLADLMTAQGVPWRREQVLRVESGQRDISAYEAVVVAQVLGVPLWILYSTAGYPNHLISTATAESHKDVPAPVWTPEAMNKANGNVRAYMSGDNRPRRAVEHLLDLWREYEKRSGRTPNERGERRKRAALWRQYEVDPEGFVRHALKEQGQ